MNFLPWVLAGGCGPFGHYPVNDPLDKYDPGYGHIAQKVRSPGNSEELLLILSFSGGTRASAFSYGKETYKASISPYASTGP